jgi:hypothetical protein
MVILGIGYSLFLSSIWICIPHVVDEKVLGTAFGISFAISNLAASFVPTLGNLIHDNTLDNDFGFFWESIYWSMFALLGIVINFLILKEDNRKNN